MVLFAGAEGWLTLSCGAALGKACLGLGFWADSCGRFVG